MKNYVERGETLTAPAPYPCTAGQGCLIGHVFGVVKGTALVAAAMIVLELTGVYDLAKNPGDSFALGDLVYWDDVHQVVTSNAGGTKMIGTARTAALAADATARVRLNGGATN